MKINNKTSFLLIATRNITLIIFVSIIFFGISWVINVSAEVNNHSAGSGEILDLPYEVDKCLLGISLGILNENDSRCEMSGGIDSSVEELAVGVQSLAIPMATVLSVDDMFNDRLAVLVGSDGHFNIGAFPDPLTGGSTSGSWNLTFRWPSAPWSSYTTFRIDGVDSIYGNAGTVVQTPVNTGQHTNQSIWKIGDIEITQTLQIVFNNQTNEEDVAKISYEVKNTGLISHEVGSRIMLDTDLNYNDGAPFRVPGDGIITTEKEYIGAAIPDTFTVYYNVTDDVHVSAATLKGGGIISPDRLVLARWPGISGSAYDFTVSPGSALTYDSAYAVYWNPTLLAPGESRIYTTFYGLARLQADLTPPLALGITAPATLSVINNAYSPNPFAIMATVLNNGSATAENVTVALNLTNELTFISGTQTQNLGNLPIGQERQVSWSVHAAHQDSEQTLTYSVDAVATNASLKNVSGQIILPAIVSSNAQLALEYSTEEGFDDGTNDPYNTNFGAHPDKGTANKDELTFKVVCKNEDKPDEVNVVLDHTVGIDKETAFYEQSVAFIKPDSGTILFKEIDNNPLYSYVGYDSPGADRNGFTEGESMDFVFSGYPKKEVKIGLMVEESGSWPGLPYVKLQLKTYDADGFFISETEETLFFEEGFDKEEWASVHILHENSDIAKVKMNIKESSQTETWIRMFEITESISMQVDIQSESAELRDFVYENGEQYAVSSTFPKGEYQFYFEVSNRTETLRFPETESLSFTTGYSNVAFLPAFQASRLYRPDPDGPDNEDQLWTPTHEQDVEQLFMFEDLDGNIKSEDQEIYTRDIINAAAGFNIYKTFIKFMDDKMVGEGLIKEWAPLPYDWRLSFDDILSSGKKTGENLSYLEATSSPFILQEIRRLVLSSDTGKVTIVTHSNGGLLAKYLLSELEDVENLNHDLYDKIDNFIMIAAPQMGTPKAMMGLLHGDEQNLVGGILLDKTTAREFGENMPGAYNLLPSEKYFDIVSDPVISFSSDCVNIPELADLASTSISTYADMLIFFNGYGGEWEKSDVTDKDVPNVLNDTLLGLSETVHQKIDSWQPAGSLKITQLAGWGIKTIKGVEYDDCDTWGCSDTLEHLDRDMIQTHVGDGTVVMLSALITENAGKYYVNVRKYNKEGIWNQRYNRDHASLFEVNDIHHFIKNILIGKSNPENGDNVENITSSEPELEEDDLTLDFILHSPVELHLYDEDGRHTGLIDNPDLDSDIRLYEKQIPNSYYIEFGEKKYAGADMGIITVILKGEDLGIFTLDIKEMFGEDVLASTAFFNIPMSANTTATLKIKNSIDRVILYIDTDSDGVTDISITSSEEFSAKDSLEVLVEIIQTMDIHKNVKKILTKHVHTARKLVEKDNLHAADKILKNTSRIIRTFTKDNISSKLRIPEEEAEKLIRIIESIREIM